MARFYTDEDVARWELADRQCISLHLERLAKDLPQRQVDFHLGMLALSYESQGLTCIAKGKFQEAIEAFRANVETICKQYERFKSEKGRAQDASVFQSILVAFVTKDETLVSKLVRHYRPDNGAPDSVFLGGALKLVAMNDIDAAKESLKKKKPRVLPEWVGYAECLEAIVDKDPRRFVASLDVAAKSWAKVVGKRERGLPSAVCFVQGAGFVCLAEKVIGSRISVANEFIPAQLLQ